MINPSRCRFVKSAPGRKDFLTDRRQIVFLGRSNVGKSSLINAWTGIDRLAYVSKTPGRTRMLTYFDLDGRFYLVDAPGYGFYMGAEANFEPLMLAYLGLGRKVIARAYLLLDSRREVNDDDLSVLNMLQEHEIPYRIVFTKADKLNQAGKARLAKQIGLNFPDSNVIITSVAKREGLDKLTRDISLTLKA